MLDANESIAVELGPGPPIISIVIDTEAEFNWSAPFARNLTGVHNLQRLEPVQRLFERYGAKPAYMVDYAVSSQRDGYDPLLTFLAAGSCEIGVHLQPWETPPFEEKVTEINSFVCNLPLNLQREKLASLTTIVQENFGFRPTMYKAGRYGVGPATSAVLAELGYQIDLSVLPGTDLRHQHGPDFRHCPSGPYWFGPNGSLLEIPMTVGFVGLLAAASRTIYSCASAPLLRRLSFPGMLARLRLLERIILTPEGVTIEEQIRLTEALLRQGHRSFTLSFHSPSLMPGSTPYVRSERELGSFIDRLEAYLDYFFGKLGGVAMTPSELRGLALASRPMQAN